MGGSPARRSGRAARAGRERRAIALTWTVRLISAAMQDLQVMKRLLKVVSFDRDRVQVNDGVLGALI